MRHGFLEDFLVWFLIVGVLFLIRDSILFFGIPKDIKHEVIDWEKLRRERIRGSVSFSSVLFLLNRVILFPIFLILYIAVILLKQLDIQALSDILSTKSWIEYLLLGAVAVSWLATIFRESFDSAYQRITKDYWRTRVFVFVTIVLALLAVYVVFSETTSLGLLALPISSISGLLVFLVGVLLLEEDDHERGDELPWDHNQNYH